MSWHGMDKPELAVSLQVHLGKRLPNGERKAYKFLGEDFDV